MRGSVLAHLRVTSEIKPPLKRGLGTGKSLSEALIFASINPQYDIRVFIELPFTGLVVFMCWTVNSMNNLLSYRGLVDSRISASEKDLHALTGLLGKL